MKRRLFIEKLAVAGIAIPLLPTHGFADSSVVSWEQQAVDDIRQGFLGVIRQIHLTHIYHPTVTGSSALLKLVQQGFKVASALVGEEIPLDRETFFKESPSSRFGSYAAQCQMGSIRVNWQGLARCGGDPVLPTQLIQLIGSKGILSTSPDGTSYQIQDYTGRVLRQMSSKSHQAYPKASITV